MLTDLAVVVGIVGLLCSHRLGSFSLPPPLPLQLEVQENYRDNPFHNFRHCFSVTQMVRENTSVLCGLTDLYIPSTPCTKLL